MLTREVKLYPTTYQKDKIETMMKQLVSVYNFSLIKVEIQLHKSGFINEYEIITNFNGHGKKSGLPQDSIAESVKEACRAYRRYILPSKDRKTLGEPKKKSGRNYLKTIVYGQGSRLLQPKGGRVNIPLLGSVRCSKNVIPPGKVRGGRLVKKASGFYLQFVGDFITNKTVTLSKKIVGIDFGFKDLVVTSDSIKFKSSLKTSRLINRIKQSQRGKKYKLYSRLLERLSNSKRDRNHKISRQLVNNYSTIVVPVDNYKKLKSNHRMGKGVDLSALYQLRTFIAYKSQSCGRNYIEVSGAYTTKMCSVCWVLTGPSGMNSLNVRAWGCVGCGTQHDRDINSANVILQLGLGRNLRVGKDLKSTSIGIRVC